MPEFMGGPMDGKIMDVESDKILIPEMAQRETIWVEGDQPAPAYRDAFGNIQFGKRPEFISHVYRRGPDGKMHYEGKEGE